MSAPLPTRAAALTMLLFTAGLIAVTPHARSGEPPASDTRRSSYLDMSPSTRAMQDDDTSNPALLWVLDGEALWRRPDGRAKKSCADCHGEARTSMRGAAVRYPAFDESRMTPVNLEGRINNCRIAHQEADPLQLESKAMLSLSAYVGYQSRGLPIESSDARLAPLVEQGRALFMGRQGQLNLACTHCHDDNAGRRLAGIPIPQGHPTGYPLYRLEWQTLGSLHRRLRNCLSGMRARNFPPGSPELLALEAYLMSRAAGLKSEVAGRTAIVADRKAVSRIWPPNTWPSPRGAPPVDTPASVVFNSGRWQGKDVRIGRMNLQDPRLEPGAGGDFSSPAKCDADVYAPFVIRDLGVICHSPYDATSEPSNSLFRADSPKESHHLAMSEPSDDDINLQIVADSFRVVSDSTAWDNLMLTWDRKIEQVGDAGELLPYQRPDLLAERFAAATFPSN